MVTTLPYNTEDVIARSKAMLEQTKAEGSKAFAGSSYEKALAKPKPPTKATDVNVVGGIKMPSLKSTFGDPSSAIASNAGVANLLKQNEENMKLMNERDVANTTKDASFLKQLMGGTTRQEERARVEKQAGITEADKKIQSLITESESLAKDYAATVQKRDEHIARLEENNLGALDAGVDQRVLQAEKYYSSQLNRKSADINAKAAVIQALQGNVNSARNYINQAVDDFVADRKDKVDAFLTFREMNQDVFDRIDKRYSDAYDTAMQFAVSDYENSRQEKLAIGEMMLKYNSLGAGITLNDSLEDAFRKGGSVAASGGDVGDGQFTIGDTRYDKYGNVIVTNPRAGSGTDPAYAGETIPMNEDTARELETLGVGTDKIIAVQNYLNEGYSLKQIAQDTGMPGEIYNAFARLVQKVF